MELESLWRPNGLYTTNSSVWYFTVCHPGTLGTPLLSPSSGYFFIGNYFPFFGKLTVKKHKDFYFHSCKGTIIAIRQNLLH